MKCITVCQPFADLITSGRKTIELRTWNTAYRGEILIHSALKVRRDDARRLKMGSEFVTGAIIGKAEIYDTKRYGSQRELRADRGHHHASVPYHDKIYGFMLKNAKIFRVPVPYKGKLGIYDVRLPKTRVSNREIVADIMDEEYRYQWVNHH